MSSGVIKCHTKDRKECKNSWKKDSLYQAKQELLREIEEVKTSLAIAHSNFDNVNDPDLVDSCIYEMTAIQYKYKYLLRRMRQFEGESTPMRSIR